MADFPMSPLFPHLFITRELHGESACVSIGNSFITPVDEFDDDEFKKKKRRDTARKDCFATPTKTLARQHPVAGAVAVSRAIQNKRILKDAYIQA